MNKGQFALRCAVVGVAAMAIVGFITMLLWNWLIPSIFGIREITYLEAIGLLLLSKILLWGFGSKRASMPSPRPHWKHRFYEKVSSMSPADREAFKEKMKEKWCRWEKESKMSTEDSNMK